MLKSIKYLTAGAAIAATLPITANAEGKIAASGDIGTLGGNLELKAQINDFFDIRGGYNYFVLDADETYSGISYGGDLDMSGFGAYLDFRPFKNSFVISAGAHFGDKEIDLQASATENITIGDQTFTPDQAGVLDLKAEMDGTSPFLGLGFDTTFQGEGAWGYKILAGVLMTGEPVVTLESRDGEFSTDATFLAELEKERQIIEDDVQDFEYYPVLQAGLSYRF